MAGSLSEALRNSYPSGVRSRGDSYYALGRVTIQEADTTFVYATVIGSEEYDVDVDWSGPSISVDCNCPYFADHGLCKHIWATARTYDASDMSPSHLAGKLPTSDMLNQFMDDEPEAYGYDSRYGARSSGSAGRSGKASKSKAPAIPAWKQQIARLPGYGPVVHTFQETNWPGDTQLVYQINVASTLQGNGLTLDVLARNRKKNGDWGSAKPRTLSREKAAALPDPLDRQITAMLLGANTSSYGYYGGYYDSRASGFLLHGPLLDALLPLLCASGRCHLRTESQEVLPPLQLDDGPAWEFAMECRKDSDGKDYILSGLLHRDQERVDLSAPVMLYAGNWVFWPERVARLNAHDAFSWILLLRREKEIRVPVSQVDELVESLAQMPAAPPMQLPEELGYQEVVAKPRPCLRIRKPKHTYGYGRDGLHAELGFDYEGHTVPVEAQERGIYLKESRRLILRDRQAEGEAAAKLRSLGLRDDRYSGGLQLATRHLPRIVATLVNEGWDVQADGSLYRRAGHFEISVSSGIDWFELHGKADFGGVTASLPQLLAALKKGEQTVRLDDGSLGILPEEWLRKFGLLANVAKTEKDHLRFQTTQAGFLDALLASQPEATFDAGFRRAREELRRFERIEPADAPAGFVGQLRPYQQEGLGWLHFLQRFGFGGCLADDMGLGKTVQVLAMLESRRELRAASTNGDRPAPSLAVVPKSLIFNWQQEAARFAPELRVLDHTGTGRKKAEADHFDQYDLVLTTYGTLRSDAVYMKDVTFDYLIFDESQAIKNAGTASAKAARLLKGRHRLCLSGTPIENHLGELWSQFEVLNPGMLGTSPVLATGTNGNGKGGPDDATRQLLAKALRPFILRRTKSQVARDLPEKTEQTLYCQLEGAQRKYYDELRDHYRQALLTRVSREGLNKAKIQILEALLRLRQAAIHPGLIDKARQAESSAKLEALLPQLQELVDEGHKALVFSQFTSMLSIIRSRLDKEKIVYEYLDGRTRDRQARVDQFQNDPACGLFLISLKAGGLGLNLTAAEYVFLLDPWWNPAVEVQAIDRAHRIGQQRQVFAYRLIAKDTVEDRILELQQSKRSLADAIINADNSLIRDLSREDLELLLR